MNIVIAGVGYVGLVTGLGLAKLGHNIQFLDTDSNKIKKLKDGEPPFFEPNLEIYLNNECKDDPSEVIIDEFIGQSIPLLFLINFNLYEVLLAFCAFRFFDITKIYPINKAEKLSGAKGVILDDIIAGIYSLIIIMFYKIVLFF